MTAARRTPRKCSIDAVALATARANPLLLAQLTHARAKLDFARHQPEAAVASFDEAHALIEPLGDAIRTGAHRAGTRPGAPAHRGAAGGRGDALGAQGRLNALDAHPALQRCENELAACGLSPSARKTRDYAALTPQELAVTRLVVSGMTNREVSEELMLSTKTVEFHLSNIYTKLGVRSRSELRARARANELVL